MLSHRLRFMIFTIFTKIICCPITRGHQKGDNLKFGRSWAQGDNVIQTGDQHSRHLRFYSKSEIM